MKGDKDNPIHASDLHLVTDPTDYGSSRHSKFIWAKTIAGSAVHENLRLLALGIYEPFPMTFNKQLDEYRNGGYDIHWTMNDWDLKRKKAKQKLLIHEGREMVQRMAKLTVFSQMDIIGQELSFLWENQLNGIWYSGTADLIFDREGIPVIWDYKTSTKLEVQHLMQHHLYPLASKYGYWTRKATKKPFQHSLDFSASDDWFQIPSTFNYPVLAPFDYVWLHALIRKGYRVFNDASEDFDPNYPKEDQMFQRVESTTNQYLAGDFKSGSGNFDN